MKVLQGTVVDGRIIVDGHLPEEGTKVTIVDESDEIPYQISPGEEAALEEGNADIDRGDYVTPEQLLAEIRRARG